MQLYLQALYAFHGMNLRQWKDHKIVLAHGIKANGGTAHTSTHFQPQHKMEVSVQLQL